jgi:hypothetical protein
MSATMQPALLHQAQKKITLASFRIGFLPPDLAGYYCLAALFSGAIGCIGAQCAPYG